MGRQPSTIVVLRDGTRATIETWQSAGSDARALVSVAGGPRVWVPISAFSLLADGTYTLPIDLAQLEQVPAVFPVLEEHVSVGRRVRETGTVHVRKVVHEREEIVTPTVMRETVEIERVAVGRAVDGPVAVRQEGDTLIVPVLEEKLVVVRQLVLVEELRITRRREQTPGEPQRVTLRREEILVERESAPGEPSSHA